MKKYAQYFIDKIRKALSLISRRAKAATNAVADSHTKSLPRRMMGEQDLIERAGAVVSALQDNVCFPGAQNKIKQIKEKTDTLILLRSESKNRTMQNVHYKYEIKKELRHLMSELVRYIELETVSNKEHIKEIHQSGWLMRIRKNNKERKEIQIKKHDA